MDKDIIKAIIVTTTCPNFRDGGMLIIDEEATKLPLKHKFYRQCRQKKKLKIKIVIIKKEKI